MQTPCSTIYDEIDTSLVGWPLLIWLYWLTKPSFLMLNPIFLSWYSSFKNIFIQYQYINIQFWKIYPPFPNQKFPLLTLLSSYHHLFHFHVFSLFFIPIPFVCVCTNMGQPMTKWTASHSMSLKEFDYLVSQTTNKCQYTLRGGTSLGLPSATVGH